jgi:hypothetical protein
MRTPIDFNSNFIFLIYFLFILQKYTTVSNFSKTNMLPPLPMEVWPMTVGANHHVVAHGGLPLLPWVTAVVG